MDSKELQKYLDSLDNGLLGARKEWEWDRARRASNLGETYKDQISRTNKSKDHTGKNNHRYGKGDRYKVTSPEGEVYEGYPSDIRERYNITPANLREYAQRAKPCIKGKFKGYLFEIYKP